MSAGHRVVALAAVCALAVGGTTAYVLTAREQQQRAAGAAPTQDRVAVSDVQRGPRIVFRNTAIGPDYGKVAMVPLAAPGSVRAITGLSCDRVFAAGPRTLCLSSRSGVVTTYRARALLEGGSAVDLPLTGIPSRARLSGDGALAATTSFVAGDSYAAEGFSTRTVVSRLDGGSGLDLETFRLVHRGRRVAPVDRNFWGVTFARDGTSFLVTVAFGGQTHLARGSLASRTVTTLREDAECPSLSPDQTKVAYKKRQGRARGDWRLAVLDLASGRETVLAEDRSVDDQVEWLDDATVLYGLPGGGTHAAETNVWAVPADGTGAPRLLIEKAWSPAVVR